MLYVIKYMGRLWRSSFNCHCEILLKPTGLEHNHKVWKKRLSTFSVLLLSFDHRWFHLLYLYIVKLHQVYDTCILIIFAAWSDNWIMSNMQMISNFMSDLYFPNGYLFDNSSWLAWKRNAADQSTKPLNIRIKLSDLSGRDSEEQMQSHWLWNPFECNWALIRD